MLGEAALWFMNDESETYAKADHHKSVTFEKINLEWKTIIVNSQLDCKKNVFSEWLNFHRQYLYKLRIKALNSNHSRVTTLFLSRYMSCSFFNEKAK